MKERSEKERPKRPSSQPSAPDIEAAVAGKAVALSWLDLLIYRWTYHKLMHTGTKRLVNNTRANKDSYYISYPTIVE